MAAQTTGAAQGNAAVNQGVQGSKDATIWGIDNVGNPYVAFLLKLFLALVVVAILVVISKVIARFVTKRIQAHSIADDEYTQKMSLLIGNIVYYVLLIFSLLIGFEVLGFDFALILGGISFGIGFAFKEIFGNMIAGVMVLTNDEFKLGDIIEIEAEDRYFGRIEEITIRYTVLRTLDLRRVVIPNLTMISVPIRTYDSEELVRLETLITIHFKSNVDEAFAVIKDAVNSLDFVREKESTRVLIENFGGDQNFSSGINVKIYFYIDPSAGRIPEVAISDVNTAIFAALNAHGIVFAYPHTVLTVDHNDKDLLASLIYVAKATKNDGKI